MKLLKKILPDQLKKQIHLVKRIAQDLSPSRRYKYAKAGEIAKVVSTLEVRQEIKKSHLYKNKISNLRIAAKRIEPLLINHGQLFSFWKAVGKPVAKNGFVKGRNIQNGKLIEDYGGGLCQISGIIYHVSMLAGLSIVGRFNHSVDIYSDETRYSPLGMDATVVYPQKDLIIENPYNFPIQFEFKITDMELVVLLLCAGQVEKQELKFEKTETKEKVFVKVVSPSLKIPVFSEYIKQN